MGKASKAFALAVGLGALGGAGGARLAHAGGPGDAISAAIADIDGHRANEAVAVLAPLVPPHGGDATTRCVLGVAYAELKRDPLARVLTTACEHATLPAGATGATEPGAWVQAHLATLDARRDPTKLAKMELHGAEGTLVEVSDWSGVVIQLPATVWLVAGAHTITAVADPSGAPIAPPITLSVKVDAGQSTLAFVPATPPAAKPTGVQTVNMGEDEAGTPPTVGGPVYEKHGSMLPKRYRMGAEATGDEPVADDEAAASPLSVSAYAGVWVEDLGDRHFASPTLSLTAEYALHPRFSLMGGLDVGFPAGAGSVGEVGGLSLAGKVLLWQGHIGRVSLVGVPRVERVWGRPNEKVELYRFTVGGALRVDHLAGTELVAQFGCRTHVGLDAGNGPACGLDLGFTFGANQR